jgi:putative protease
MGLHNLEGVKFAVETCGFRRVVLSRETPLEEIKRIKDNIDVEIEYFVQGALCVSFSGNCYMSSYLFGASGNRGRCKQLCRLPFALKKKGEVIKNGYLLSAKEFDMSARLEDLEKAGVDSLKIEGRARRPYYVGAVTKQYRRLLDGKGFNHKEIELAFNRGYTAGYFDGNGKIISELQNHIGIPVGKVVKVNNGKNFNQVFFVSNQELSPKSTFKVFNGGQEKTVLTAYDLTKHGKEYMLTTTQSLRVGDTLNLISDAVREEDLSKQTLRRAIKIKIFAKVGEPILAKFSVGDSDCEVQGEVLSSAQKQPLTREELIDNFNKSEYFCADIEVEKLDSVFIAKSQLNAFRRKVFDAVQYALVTPYKRTLAQSDVQFDGKKALAFNNFQFVKSLDVKFIEENVIFSPENYSIDSVQKFVDKCSENKKTAYLDTPNFALEKDIELLKEIIEKTGVKIVANNYYALSFDADMVIGGGLNVYNTVAGDYYGLPIITAESGVIEKNEFAVMTLRHCPMKAHLNASCANCPYESGYVYQMESGQEFSLTRKKLSTCTFYLERIGN